MPRFTGGFIAGARLGFIGLGAMYLNERDPNGADAPDIALNSVSTRLGFMSAGPLSGIYPGVEEFRRNGLAQAIRDIVCE